MCCRVKDHHNLLLYSPLSKKTFVRQISVRQAVPPEPKLSELSFAWRLARARSIQRRYGLLQELRRRLGCGVCHALPRCVPRFALRTGAIRRRMRKRARRRRTAVLRVLRRPDGTKQRRRARGGQARATGRCAPGTWPSPSAPRRRRPRSRTGCMEGSLMGRDPPCAHTASPRQCRTQNLVVSCSP